MEPIARAVEILGGPTKVALILGVTPQAVWFWRDGHRRLPAEYCPPIEKATDRVVRCEDLRPDVDWGVVRNSHLRDGSDSPPGQRNKSNQTI